MLDLETLEKIGRKYVGKKYGYDFDREIRNELKASLLVRMLENLTKKNSICDKKKEIRK